SVCAAAALLPSPAAGATQPIELAAPYEYLGWGEPQPPAGVIAATGSQDLTLAFILSHGKCNPEWDGQGPLLGGSDQAAIESIRAAGAEVDVSFGGWSGKKLGSSCKTPTALAAAYRKVIDAYSLKAIDIDVEHGEFTKATVRKRVIEALAIVHAQNPATEISVTFGTEENGPEATGRSLIADAAAIGFQPSAWTVMPFDFGRPLTDMGHASIRALEGLARDLVSAYGISPAAAYQHAGISSMDGHTDEASETVSVEDFETMLAFAQQNHLARFTFWAVNRDRQCAAGQNAGEDCSGITQQPYAFADVVARYHG
ncbi:MAG: Chitinase, partial [Solirubrobacterales bacterium]|nr:Chitinase [Solirubrobacterales bacterium]